MQTVMLYGSKAWAVKDDDIQRLQRTGMRMVRWMCGASLNVRPGGVGVANDELKDRMNFDCFSVVMLIGRLRWFGHVKRMEDGNWVKRMRSMNVEGVSARGRAKTTWNEVIQKDLIDIGLNREAAGNQAAWRAAIR